MQDAALQKKLMPPVTSAADETVDVLMRIMPELEQHELALVTGMHHPSD